MHKTMSSILSTMEKEQQTKKDRKKREKESTKAILS
jgi:hypothetical protein